MKVVEQFKRRILDLAIRGKLVPQDPNDEPAGKLLARIKAEKEKLIKAGKIKKGKSSAVSSDGAAYEKLSDDVPFELPKGWAWCRLGDLTILITSGSRSWAQFYTHNQDDPLFLRMGNLSRNSFSLRLDDLQHVRLPKDAEGTRTAVLPGDLLFSITAEIGMMGLIPEDFPTAFINQHTALIRFCDIIKGLFIPYALLSSFAKEQYASRKHGMKISFRLDSIEDVIIPLPPLNEQKRIVTCIEELFKVADSLGAATNGIEATAKRLDKKILDLAICGKLVSQDPSDEPARELLKRIAITSHKSPCKNHEAPIEPPFKIPKSWEWAKLGTISNYGQCRSVDAQSISAETWSLDLEEIEKETGRLIVRKTAADKKSTSSKHLFCKGMVLYSKLRTYLNKVLVADMDGVCTSEIVPISVATGIIPEFLRIVLMSPYFLQYTDSKGYGVKMPRVGTNDMRESLIPIPPSAEQQRIVDRVKELKHIVALLSAP